MISILIPIYNGIEYLAESLASVIDQTYTEWEVIIGINGHPPNSDVQMYANKVKSLLCNREEISSKFRILHYTTKGKSATLNAMIKDCKFDLVAILDVDDIWMSTKLEEQSKYWYQYDVVGTKCQYFGDRSDIPDIPVGDISNLDFLSINPIINSSAIIKKQYAKWNEHSILEDYELWIELRKNNKTFYNIPDALCLHRIHTNSAFNNINHIYVNELKSKYT